MGFSILISAEVYKHSATVWYLDGMTGVLIGLIILAYGVKYVFSLHLRHTQKIELNAYRMTCLLCNTGLGFYDRLGRLSKWCPLSVKYYCRLQMPFFYVFLLCHRLLVDMIPRVRQTRNYERFE